MNYLHKFYTWKVFSKKGICAYFYAINQLNGIRSKALVLGNDFLRLIFACQQKGFNFPPGIFYWNPFLFAYWYGGHHGDVNEQMNYWPADLCNMSETMEPYFQMLDDYEEAGRQCAKIHYNSRGRIQSGISIWGMMWTENFWAAGTGWYAQHYWDHYQYTQDKEFLKERGYPFVKDAALFYMDYLAEDPETGTLTSFPDMSPENQYINEEGGFENWAVGPTMTLAVARETIGHFIKFSEILGVDEELREEAKAVLPKIAPYQIGKNGQLQEWMKDYEERWPGHRHLSNLYPVYPGYQISPRIDRKFSDAAKVSLERRMKGREDYGYVGWSWAWMLNIAARLEEPKMAYESASTFIQWCVFPSMIGTHGMGYTRPEKAVNCIDGNFGYTAGVAEMLLQSQLGKIHLLPALPKEWSEGSIRGLKARGGYEVGIIWKKGKLTAVSIEAMNDGNGVLFYDGKEVRLPVKAGESYVLDGQFRLIR